MTENKYPIDDIRGAGPAPPYGAPAFRFKHEVRAQERPYDYYEAHPEHRPRRQTRRTLRRLIREG